jgi:hypothetical protein
MSAWLARARVIAALALAIGAMSCSRSSETSEPPAPPASGVTCLDAPLPEGWRLSVESDFEPPPEDVGGSGMPILMNSVLLTGEAARYDKDPSTPLSNQAIKARVYRSPVGPITGEHRQIAQRQTALGNWRRAREPTIHADGYVTYEAHIPEINLSLLELVHETDDSNGNCGLGGCRIFVVDNQRGVTLDIDMPDQITMSLPEMVRDLEPVAAHVLAHCEIEQ